MEEDAQNCVYEDAGAYSLEDDPDFLIALIKDDIQEYIINRLL